MNNKTYLIFGVSKGLGKVITTKLPNDTDLIFGVSRTQPDYLKHKSNLNWISADLSNPESSSQKIKDIIKNQKIDYLIYNVGIWENNAFSEDYDFEQSTATEISTLIQTNITACILNIQLMLENLKQSSNAKIILIGSTWGLENHNSKEVTFSATKFALRGIAHSLRENLRKYKIGISVLNLGYLATEFENEEDIQTVIEKTEGNLIPLHDVVNALQFIISTSNASCVKEITMPAMNDLNV